MLACIRSGGFLSAVLTILFSQCIFVRSNENEMDSILEEIQKEYKRFEIGDQKNIVLLLGNTGTGKSTLGLLLTGAELDSVRVSPGVFAIVDKNDLISRNSTTVSKTKVPNLMFDQETNTTYYDCPGFADSRGIVIDITATRSIHDLLDFAKNIKVLFTVSYQSVKLSVGDRNSFRELAGHAVKLIKNIEKYGKGMALVVTKVQNLYDYNENNEKILVDDAAMIESIANFLIQVKSDLENKRANKMTQEERRLNEEKIKFTEILLERESNEYTRINIFRLVERPGPLKDMELIPKEKQAIKTMVNYNIDYVPTDENDFGYSISDETIKHVADLISQLEDRLEKYLDHICADLETFYSQHRPFMEEVENIKAAIGVENFFQLHSNHEFIKHFRESVARLGIEMNADILKSVSKSIDFLDFLQIISKSQSSSISTEIVSKLKQCANDLLDRVESQLRIDIPDAISFYIKHEYITLDKSDPQILNTLKTFISVGLDKSSGVNSTVLKSITQLTTDEHFKHLLTSVEFLDFLNLLNDQDRQFSVHISRELRVCLDQMEHDTEHALSDDVISVIDAIRAFYVQVEKENYLNFEKVHGETSTSQQKLRQINTESLETLVKDLFTLVDQLNIHKLIENDKRISRAIEFMQIIQENMSVPENIVYNFNKCKKYVDDSELWYRFLLELRDDLVTTESQTSSIRSEGNILMAQSISDEEDTRSAEEIGLNRILDYLSKRKYLRAMQHIEIGVFKLKAVQALWSQALSDMVVSCQSDGLIVKSYVISISKVVKLECWSNAKVIKIFALNTILIDEDINKNGKRVEMSIIAPKWEIVPKWEGSEKRLIDLEGEHGTDYPSAANAATKKTEQGEHGLAGLPGCPGSNFLGIGNKFVNSDALLIDVAGGKGGGGQEGGTGGDGIEGETPPFWNNKGYIRNVRRKGWQCDQTYRNYWNTNPGYDRRRGYKCFGKKGSRGGKGGDGACGGFGGNPGVISIVALDDTPGMIIYNRTGTTGLKGHGGLGGRSTRYGRTLYIKRYEWSRMFNRDNDEYSIDRDEPGEIIPAGENGGYGTYCDGIKAPVNVSFHSTPSIIGYEEYARESLANGSVWKSNVEHFVIRLTTDERLDSFFGIIDLIEEFNSLEGQYFHLHKQVDFSPFYEALKHRIERHVEHIGESSDERESVKLLYTAVISKLLAMKTQGNHIAVINLLTYIDTIKSSIAKLAEDKRVEYISEQRDNYKHALDEKMHSANLLVQLMVVPAIEKVFNETETNIQELLNEAIVKHNRTEKALEIAKENKRKLEKSMLWHNILAPFKAIGSLLALAGPEGAIVGAVVSGGSSFAESIIDGGLQPQKISTPAAPYKELIQKITKDFMRQQLLFSEQLRDLDEILSGTNSTGFDEIRKVVRDVTIQMDKPTKFDKNFVTDVTNEVEKGKKAIDSVLDKTKSYYDGLKEKDAVERIKKMQTLLKVADVGIDIYKQNRKDNSKLDEINSQIQNLQDQLNTWKQYEEDIKGIMLPQLKEIEASFEKSSKDLSGKSHVELDISKWKIQSALADLKKLFREMASAQKSLLEGDLLHCIEKVGEGITTMITVYDRIDSYAEQSKLASLISNVALGSSDNINDPALKKAAINLDKIVHTNLILERFESVMQALKQHKFPHARRYLEVFYKLPTDLKSNDTENVIKTVHDNIDHLVNELIISKSSLEIPDINSFSDQYFGPNRPFFTWRHQDFGHDIQQLLMGNIVTLKSDISNGMNYTAVKFNEISIYFKLANEHRQKELDQILEKYEILMVMVGNCYYRCNDRIYYISMDKDVALIFHMNNGHVVGKNDIYKKITESDYFLSPYTVWNIQLTPKGYSPTRQVRQIQNYDMYERYEDLLSFKNEQIDLQLTGVGQIIKNKIKTEMEICSSDLDNYYTLDRIE